MQGVCPGLIMPYPGTHITAHPVAAVQSCRSKRGAQAPHWLTRLGLVPPGQSSDGYWPGGQVALFEQGTQAVMLVKRYAVPAGTGDDGVR